MEGGLIFQGDYNSTTPVQNLRLVMYTLNVQYLLFPSVSTPVTVTAVVPIWNVAPVGMLYKSVTFCPLLSVANAGG